MAKKLTKEAKVRSDNIRSLWCLVCGNPECAWHHVIGHGYSAMGMKAPDDMTFGLCNKDHMDLHDHGWRAWEEKHGKTQLEYVAIQNELLDLMGMVS